MVGQGRRLSGRRRPAPSSLRVGTAGGGFRFLWVWEKLRMRDGVAQGLCSNSKLGPSKGESESER